MPDPIDRHASRFPRELAAGIEGLDKKRKRAIFVLLFDEPRLSYTEIRNELSGEEVLASESLSTSLTELKEAGLINKQVRGADDDSRFTSAYSVSAFGELFFRSLLSALGTGDGSFVAGELRQLGDPGAEIRLSAAP